MDAMKMIQVVFMPCASLFSRGKSTEGLICLFLQLTMLGWIPAILWAIVTEDEADREAENRRLEIDRPETSFRDRG